MMREALSLRAHHWLILIGALVYGSIYAGMLDVRGIAAWFAARPEVAKAFADPDSAVRTRSFCCSRRCSSAAALLLGLLMLIFVSPSSVGSCCRSCAGSTCPTGSPALWC